MNGIAITNIHDTDPLVLEDGKTLIWDIPTGLPGVELKIACWKPGHRSDRSAHPGKHEWLHILSGNLGLYAGDAADAQETGAGSIVDIPPGDIHGHAVPEGGEEVWATAIFALIPATAS